MEKRALFAALLSALVLFLWFAIFPPQREEKAAPVVEPTKGELATAQATPVVPVPTAPTGSAPAAVRGEEAEEIALEGADWKALIDSRGGVIKSFILKNYNDEEGHTLDLVSGKGPRPLSFVATGPWNEEPYAVTRDGSGVGLRWSDGEGNWVEKHVAPAAGRFGLDIAVRAGGLPARGAVVIGAGRDVKRPGGTSFGSVGAAVRVGGKLERVAAGKLEKPKELSGSIEFAGVEDHYFLFVLLPDQGAGTVRASGLAGANGPRAEVAVDLAAGALRGVLFAGPKEHRILTGYGRGLDETMSFGLFGVLSVAFLAVMRWIHSWTGNWGVAIIILTAGIRVLLFPLTHKSTVAMRRMQALQPKMKAIQDRYQDRAKRDPQVRNRMNQEVMALYKQEGVNPMGGCLPTLVQLPILWALYTLFANAIELRQAPFMLWIHDLSLPDTLFTIPFGGSFDFPFRPLALLMGGSMWLQQKLAPQVGDPAQRRMFMMLPIVFTVMFYGFASGLVLYWLVNNVLTIGQQLLTERLLREKPAAVATPK